MIIIPASAAPQGNAIVLPTPQLILGSGSADIQNSLNLKWWGESKEFLNYNPEYFLFRYMGHRDYGDLGGTKSGNRRGYKHPSHQNGSTATNSGWWAAPDINNSGSTLPGRDTEWAVSPDEGSLTTIMLPADYPNWFTNRNNLGVYPANLTTGPSNVAPAGRGQPTCRNAYFRFAIGIDLENPNTGCPKTFGEFSNTFRIGISSDEVGNADLNPFIM